ncbi:MAG TPA: DegT/DnrJ/EryC1/StrS family aminotransferase [Phycisphaerae bacterium]|nr:DegT/DnrJ/EryC1/StrS family aminotransferase [Phycisphaerae bacterium]
MNVPLVDLKASLTPIREALRKEFEAILDGMQLFLGPNVQAFEKDFTAFCEVKHGLGVSNGTDALILALKALGIGAGDEVIVPAHTFFASIEAIVHAGATPVMVDIEPGTMTIDPKKIGPMLSPKTRAIMPVHLYGHPADMDPILAIAREHKLKVIEDCAQAHGARYKGRRCGSMGDAAGFSFYFTKNLGAFGEAGFVTTPHDDLAELMKQYRHHGHVSKFEHAHVGYNFRLDELQAAVLRLKLRLLEANNGRRVAIARQYDERLAKTGLKLLKPRGDSEPVYHLYPIQTEHRDGLIEYLNGRGIGTGIHYKIPGHLQPALKTHSHRFGDMSVTEQTCRGLLSIPMYPELTDEQVDYVADHVCEFLRERAPTSRVGAR